MDIAPEWEHCRDLLLGTATGIRETGGDDTEEKKWWEVAGRKEYAIVLILKKKKKSSVTKNSIFSFEPSRAAHRWLFPRPPYTLSQNDP